MATQPEGGNPVKTNGSFFGLTPGEARNRQSLHPNRADDGGLYGSFTIVFCAGGILRCSMSKMKTPLALLVTLLMSVQFLGAKEEWTWPGDIVSYPMPDESKLPRGLDKQLPERLDWSQHMGGSTSDQRQMALMACSILWKRLLQVEEAKRKQCLENGGEKYLAAFNAMQAEWRKLCQMEADYFAGPPDEYKGSGYKAAYPLFVATQIQDRIRWLTIER
jgi:hypothetical protein